MTHIAIITPFNDLETFEGGSKASLKLQISYFDQFLILYSSIIKNWKQKKFTYSFYIIHSKPFSEARLKILNQLPEVKVLFAEYDLHETKIRPLAYTLDFDCDYRLILDVDMFALMEPDLDFTADVQAMYGGTRYNEKQWKTICSYIGAEYPDFELLQTEEGNYKKWGMNSHFAYHLEDRYLEKRLFPYFNNGAVLVKNSISKKLGELWEDYRTRYAKYLKEVEGVDAGIVGQNVIGLAIHNTTKNWTAFPRGFNFLLQNFQADSHSLIEFFDSNKVSLFHYINVPENTIYYNLVDSEYKNIRSTYYAKKSKFWNMFSKKDNS